jgi:Multiubiquitin
MIENVKKAVQIFVNGTPEEVEKKEELTYDEVVTFAYPDFPEHPERNYSIKYTKGDGKKPEGTLAPGGKVKVKDGMEFTVTPTGQS